MLRATLALLALLAAARSPALAAEAPAPDDAQLRQLNAEYVRAFLASDTARFEQLLSDDFTAVLADGRVIDRAEFLRQAATPPNARDLRLHDVSVRQYGDTALVMALVGYLRSDGAPVRTRYTSLYVRSAGRWRVAWVQWTRVSAP